MRLTLQQRKLLEWFIFVVFFFLYALLLVVVVVGIFVLLLGQSLPALQQLGWQRFFTDALWNPTAYATPQYGMGPMVASSGLVTGGAVALAIPIGVGCAAYLAEVARPWERQLLKPAIEILAGLPSVAVGFIGIAVLEPLIAGIGVILALARAAGETAPILFTGVAFFLPTLPESVFSQFMALPYHLYVLATQHSAIATVRPLAYGTALVLLGLVFLLNLTAIVWRARYQRYLRS